MLVSRPERGVVDAMRELIKAAVARLGGSNSTEERLKKLEEDLSLLASLLTNMLVMGKEKRGRCAFYEVSRGICTLMRFEVPIPTLTLVESEGTFYADVGRHPELCTVCPYWRERR